MPDLPHHLLLQNISFTPNSLLLSLPIPPTINKQYATVQGRRILSAQGRKYKTLVAQLLFTALLKHPQKRDTLQIFQTEYLVLSISFYFPTFLKRDLDGGLKITQDALCSTLGINDNRIVEIHLYKFRDPHNPRIECALSPYHHGKTDNS